MRRTSVVLAILAVVAFNDAIQSNALRLSSAAPASEKKRPRPQRKRPLRHPFKRSLKSIARAARDGSSTWGDHIASLGRASSSKNRRANKQHQSTSMKQSSSIFITKLHKKIQTQQQQQQQQQQHPKEKQMRPNKTKRYAYVKEIIDQNDEYPKEHFVQEILAVVVSGAAATSAFAAVSTGAFIATLAVAVGSLVTVLFLDDSDDVIDATLIETRDDDDSDDQEEISEEDCDITGNSDIVAEHKQKILQHEEPKFQAMKKITNYTMDELRRCYEGKPKMPLQFSHLRRDRMCIVYTESDESASSEEEKAEYSDNSLLIGDDVNSALEDACSTGDCEKIVLSVDHPKRVNVVWYDPHIDDGSNHPIDTVKPKGNDHRRRSQRIIGSDRPNSQQDNEYTESLTDAEKEGALLLSQSFRVAASVFGAVADAVRFTGETAAVCTGGTARLAGGVFRLSAVAVNSLGPAIEHGSAKRDRIAQAEEPNPGKQQRTSKRKAAGENVRLLGESIEQVADSLLLAGSATERVTFAAASIAEGAVRFVGDIAMSVSDMFATESQHALDSGLAPKEKRHMLDIATKESTRESGLHADHLDIATTSVINDTTKLDGSSIVESQMNDDDDYNDQSYFFLWAMNNVDDIMADTLGVGSLAPELIGVFVVCYLSSLILLRRQRSKDNRLVEHGKPPEKPSHISVPKEQVRDPNEPFTHDTHNDTDSHTTLTVDWTTKVETRQMRSSYVKRIAKGIFFVVLSPMKLFVLAAGWVWSLVFNRKSILLLLYSMGFLFLSRSSQYKAAVIKRKSALLGYQDAIESIGQSHVSYLESSMWLNTILHSVWRVNDNTTSDSFGGLEPYLSSFATDSLVESLSGSDKKPNGVAHVSFNSFTLGKTPPMIKGITVLTSNGDSSVAYMRIDVGILMEAELLLDISPSSLDYKMVPTTTLSINSLDAELQLDISVKSIPTYPYISNVNVSLSHALPEFSLRIEPRSQNGLKGVDFGSFPLISKWIKESIVESLHEYVAPNYISIDIPAWLNGDPRIVSYF